MNTVTLPDGRTAFRRQRPDDCLRSLLVKLSRGTLDGNVPALRPCHRTVPAS
jgi:hypothetical protein